MFSWIASRFKRFQTPKKPTNSSAAARTSHPAVIRIGRTLYKGEIIGGFSDKTLFELKRNGVPAFPKKFEVKLDEDQTFRWVNLRWHHNSQVSFQPITSWAVERARVG